MRVNKIYYFILISAIILGCKKPADRECWKSNGDITNIEIINNTAINNIHSYDKIDVVVIQNDEESRIEIEGPKNLINFISTDINNNILTIQDENKCGFLRKNHKNIKVTFYGNAIKEFHNFGTGNININQTNTAIDFFCELESSSDIRISVDQGNIGIIQDGVENTNNVDIYGQLGFLFLDKIGYGTLDTRGADINDIYIINHSTQKTYLKAKYNINGANYGNGDIYYNKDVINLNINTTNSGKLISY